jgi:hypothetical protein
MSYLKCRATVLPLAVLLTSSSALAIKVTTAPDFDLSIGVLVQPRFQGDWDGIRPTDATSIAPDGASYNGTFNADFFVKRARLYARGTIYRYFSFLITLDTPNFGVRGNYGFNQNNATFIQDLVASFEPIQDSFIDFGFLLMPLSHGSTSNPGAQSAIDAPGSILAGRLMNNAPRASREAGIQIRSLLLDRHLLLRGGVYEGARSSQGIPAPAPNAPVVNPNGRPLLGGMVRWNFVGFENTFPGFAGIYLDGKSRISVGVGGQWQGKSAVGGLVPGAPAYPDYVALAADFFVDLALPGDTEAVVQLNGYRFDYGSGNRRTGDGLAGDLGYRIGKIEPQVNFFWFNSDDKFQSMLKWAGGLNYFFIGHQAKLSAEFVGMINAGNLHTTPTLHQVILQASFLL